MDPTNPASVLKTLGEIEDSMGMREHEWANAAHAKELSEELLKRATAALFNEAQGTVEYRKSIAATRVAMTPEWDTFVNAKAELKRLDKLYESWDGRRSICQSVLKQMQHEQPPRYGQGATSGPG